MTGAIDLALHSYSLRLHYLYQPGYDVFRFIGDAADLGFTGVNIGLSGPDNHRLPPHRHLTGDAPEHIASVARHLVERSMSVEIDTDSTDPARLRAAISVARGLGAKIVRTFTHHRPGPQMLSATLRDLREIAAYAESEGVVIAVENHEEFTSEELVQMMESLASPAVRLLYDYGNSLPVLEDPAAALAAMRDWVVACHMKDEVMVAAEDAPDGVPTMIGTPLGQGTIDVARLTRVLVAGGLRRICLQNAWGYHVPLGKLRPVDVGDSRLGAGPFQYASPPFDEAVICFNPEDQLDSKTLVSRERGALEVATRHARRILTDIA